jgi:hypothetical protein
VPNRVCLGWSGDNSATLEARDHRRAARAEMRQRRRRRRGEVQIKKTVPF